MTKLTKLAAAALAALTITAAVSISEAQARPRWGYVGAGIAIGALAGAAIASSAYAGPGYYEPAYVAGPYRRCGFVEKFDRWGNYLGTRRVCSWY